MTHVPDYSASEPPKRSVLLQGLCIGLLVLMFPLIWLGGLVTSTGAGMSVPDWPNTYGYNMFAVPWDLWLGPDAGGVFQEHTHRLLASIVGLVAIVIAVVAWFREPRRWVRMVAYGTLLCICVQGVLGGMRVLLVDVDIAVVHGIFGQLTFCVAGLLVLSQTRWWHLHISGQARPRVTWWAGALTAVIVAQLVIAAIMRHYEAGLAVPDWPLHYGQILPPTDEAGLALANEARAFDYHLKYTTLASIWLHTAHRLMAYFITGLAIFVMVKAWRTGRLRGHVIVFGGLLATQVTLGVLTVLWQKPADVATLHQATGALLLLTSFILTARCARVLGWRPMEVAQTRPAAETSPAPALAGIA